MDSALCCRQRKRRWQLFKRATDLAISIPLTLALLPLFAAIAAAIKLESDGPAFFLQERIGLDFQPFRIIKFRSLRHGVPDPHDHYEMTESDPRITALGAILRKTSLDELPQLFNVILGTMSLVGVRPLVRQESEACLAHHAERFLSKPGMTGLSQVRARNGLDFEGRLDIDLTYLRTWSPPLDFHILLETPMTVLRGNGVYPQQGEWR